MVRVERDFSGTRLPYNFQITHFFITYFQHMIIFSTFTHHIYLRVGNIERAWLTKSVVPNTHWHNLIPILSLRTPGLHFTLGLPFSLPFYTITCECLCSDLSVVSLYIYFLPSWLIILYIHFILAIGRGLYLFIPSILVSCRGQSA